MLSAKASRRLETVMTHAKEEGDISFPIEALEDIITSIFEVLTKEQGEQIVAFLEDRFLNCEEEV